ncbi:hypothetical protein ScalyP_jg4579 [Parmales sp. scaly parma]|nr:hypothetical protein ScalyP_jg4579 [Parmales sp. scaly parma]
MLKPNPNDSPIPSLPTSLSALPQPSSKGKKKIYNSLIHVVHVPKCGGTSLSSTLRRASCILSSDSEPSSFPLVGSDCCVNPGPCERNDQRTCDKILTGCHNHIPDLLTLNNAEHKYTLLRNPVSRVVSAYGYRCHSPNNDCYRVREEYCQSGQLSRKECGPSTSSKVWSFEEYLELPEYHNIFTRMFGLGSKGTFPYTADANVGQVEFDAAIATLNTMDVVGLQELYSASVSLILDDLNIAIQPELDFEKKRDKSTSSTRLELNKLLEENPKIRKRIEEGEALRAD